jgi:hypothetical protein
VKNRFFIDARKSHFSLWTRQSHAGRIAAFGVKTRRRLLRKISTPQSALQLQVVLKHGDRLAICGDSITEQKKYSRLMEDYLTMCVLQLKISVRQYGWSGEKVPGFLARMTNDCLRFEPTIATTAYGMNDFEYRPYEERIGRAYQKNSLEMVEAFFGVEPMIRLTCGNQPHP